LRDGGAMGTRIDHLGGLRCSRAPSERAFRLYGLPYLASVGLVSVLAVSACSSNGNEESYPSLSSVPNQPRSASAEEDRQQTSEDLQADLERGTKGETKTRAAASAGGLTLQAEQPQDQAEQTAAVSQAPGSLSPSGGTAVISSEGLSTNSQVGGQAGGSEANAGGLAQGWNPQRSELAAIIYFNHGSDSLNTQDYQVLEGVSTLYRMRGGKVRVVGHSSARTKTASATDHRVANFDISVSRADAVAGALYEIGLPTEDVITEAKSDSQPVYHEFMPTGEAGNRRVEIYLEK